MKTFTKITIYLTMSLWAATASAHSALEASVPADGAVVTLAPDALTLTYRNDFALTVLTISQDGAEALDLNLDDFKGFNTEYIVPLALLDSGVYDIQWRGLSNDGHAQDGAFQFTIE